MRRIFLPFAIFISTVILFASCLGKDDDDNYTYYDDTAITAFSLGTLNRYVHTISKAGADSIYKALVKGSNYKFTIDQNKREIYNPDSLPLGTDAAHVICTISAKSGGRITIKNANNDSIRLFNEADSVDFTTPREFVIYSNSGKAYRSYTIHVNVHQQEAEKFNWVKMSDAQSQASQMLHNMQALKGVSIGNSHLIYAFDGHETRLMEFSSGNDLTLSNRTFEDNTIYKNVLVQAGKVIEMQNGIVNNASTDKMKMLLAATETTIYALSETGVLVSSADGGATWTEESADTELGMLPTEHINSAVIPLKTNSDICRIVVCGNRNITEYPDDAYGMVWGKLEEHDINSMKHEWSFYNIGSENRYVLPRLNNLVVLYYGGRLIAFGNEGIGKCDKGSMEAIYESLDGGITWKSSSTYVLPDGLKGSTAPFTAFTDNDNYLWVVNANGEIWRGRLNRLGWAEEQRSFLE